ncbi:uncharacterized protein LOC117307220 [Asterias rubens]|uniref:uncharacterized protein LOC117307220 n=1 Tax=Asterias rubens TaxID=7604 RepID=UPI001455434A|nr:uncharacterized protein LOC117307220 [Asterias rubens]
MGDPQDKSTGSNNDGLQSLLKSFDHFRGMIYSLPDGGPELTKVYDDWSSTHSEGLRHKGYLAPSNLAKIAADFIIDKTARILDAASGTGMVGEELKTQGFGNIDAFDQSQGALDYSKTLGVYTNYIRDTLDEHQTQIPTDCYDAVLMAGTFGLPGHVTVACFPELIRITKTGGFIMITLNDLVIDQWKDKLDAAIEASRQKGLWELVETRWCPYMKSSKEKAMVPILKITKGNI